MNIWESLVRVSLVGSERMALDEVIYAYVNDKTGEKDRSKEEVVLDAIAIADQMGSINPKRGNYKQVIQERTEAESICPPKYVILLQNLLEESSLLALPELLRHFHKNQWSLPPEFLPQLLEHCLKDEALHQLIKPHFGQNAHWLMAQNPQWQSLDSSASLDRWAQLDTSQKRIALTTLMREAPENALNYIKNNWDRAIVADQEIFLQCLSLSPSSAFIPFLKKAKKSSRKKIREAVAVVLAKTPDSAANTFLNTYIPSLLTPQGNWQISDNYLDATEPLNLPLKMEKGIHQSMKGAWLGNMMGYINPKTWEDTLKTSVRKSISTLLDNAYHQEIFAGLTQASLLYQEEEWRAALINHQWDNRAFSFPEKTTQLLLKDLPESLFNKTGLKMAKESQQLPEKSLLHKLIKYNTTPWSSELSRLLIHRFKTDLVKNDYHPASISGYQLVFEKGAYLIALESIDFIINEWSSTNQASLEQSSSWIYWESKVYRFTQRLERRRIFLERG